MVIGGGLYSTPASSMEPVLPLHSAYLTLPLANDEVPERGTIAIFAHPSQPGVDYVKRVIGLPGDRVSLAGGLVSINGAAVERVRIEDFEVTKDRRAAVALQSFCVEGDAGDALICHLPQWRETLPGGRSYAVLDTATTAADSFPEVVVPDGHLFVLGDHRDNSLDSRFPRTGMIPIANLRQVPWRFYIGFEDLQGTYDRFLQRVEVSE